MLQLDDDQTISDPRVDAGLLFFVVRADDCEPCPPGEGPMNATISFTMTTKCETDSGFATTSRKRASAEVCWPVAGDQVLQGDSENFDPECSPEGLDDPEGCIKVRVRFVRASDSLPSWADDLFDAPAAPRPDEDLWFFKITNCESPSVDIGVYWILGNCLGGSGPVTESDEPGDPEASITVSGGGCVPINSGRTCLGVTEDECGRPETDAPVALLTGHKTERSSDMTVSLPGRDFVLAREYTSDPDFYDQDGSDYFWNGQYGAIIPGRIGAGWELNGEQYLQGVSLNGGAPARLYLKGASQQGLTRFDGIPVGYQQYGAPPVLGPNPQWKERGSGNRWIRSTTGTVYRRVESGPGFITTSSTEDVLQMREPGGQAQVSFVGDVAAASSSFGAGDLTGKISSERDEYGNMWHYEWSSLGEPVASSRDVARLRAIYLGGTPGSELARVEFHWHGDPSAGHDFDDTVDTDGRFGRLGMVEVFRDDGASEIVTNTVEYIYFDDLIGQTIGGETIELDNVYDGSPGDLVEVISSTRMTDATMHSRVWQYRYYSATNNASGTDYEDLDPLELQGRDHQLMAVVYPEQMEYYADYLMQEAVRQNATSGTLLGDDVSGLFDTYFDAGFTSVRDAAELLRWVRFDNTTVGHHYPDANAMLLPNDRWASLYDIAGKIISYYPDSSLGGEDGRVMTQLVSSGDGQAGCGCGGGTTASNLGTRFDYVYRRFVLPTGVAGSLSPGLNSNGYSAQIIESTLGFSGTTLVSTPYRVECHDFLWLSVLQPEEIAVSGDPGSRANVVKLATTTLPANPAWDEVSDPVGGSGNRWTTVYEYDLTSSGSELFTSFRKLIKKFTPAAVSSYVPAGQAAAQNPPTWTVSPDHGLVHHYDYTSGGGWADGYGISEGASGTVIPQVGYTRDTTTRPDLPTQTQRNPGTGPTGDTPVETTTITRGYHGGVLGAPPSGQEAVAVVAWERVEHDAESVAQNGPDGTVDYSSWRLWDTKGQLRWTRDEIGTLTYMAYDPATGALVQHVSDADPEGNYDDFTSAELTTTNFPGLTTGGWSVPSRSDYAELTDLMVVDELGRVTEITGPDGVSTYYTRYETRTVQRSNDDGDGMVARGIPYQTTLAFPHGYEVGVAYHFDGPITLSVSNSAGKVVLTEQYVAEPDPGYDPGDGEYAIGDLVARSEQDLLLSGMPGSTREWHDVSLTPEDGSYITSYEYDLLGRTLSVTDPEGGITLYGTVSESGYDILDRLVQISQGWADNTGSITLISKTFYDSPQDATQGVGNGNVTFVETYTGEAVGGTRSTKRWYDFRDRLVAEAPPELPNVVYAHDDLGRVVEQAAVATNTGFTGGVSSLPDPSVASADRSSYAQTLYNNRGMVYRSRVAVDPADDSDPEFLESNQWFDARGATIAAWSPNGPGVKTVFDPLGRAAVAYVTDRFDDALPGSSGNFADASSVADDRVIEQTEYAYVAAGEPGAGAGELVTHRMRLHDSTDDDALIGSNSVTTYTLYEFDYASRAVRTHAYGTNDNYDPAQPTKPFNRFVKGTPPPARPSLTGNPVDADSLMSEVFFDPWGRTVLSVSPGGKHTLSVLDALSRQIAVIEGQTEINGSDINWVDGVWVVTFPGTVETVQDRVTTFVYDGLSNVVLRTAHLDGSSSQNTRYVYGVTAVSPSEPTDSLVSSSSLLHKVHYPNESTGVADTSAAYTVTYGYNRLGELRGVTDQNATTHAYTRDLLGRVTRDEATALGTNIDDRVVAITTAYDAHGRVEEVLSLDDTDDALNGVAFGYTPLHQLATLTQHASDAPDQAGAGVVTYAYATAEPASDGVGNYSRVASVTYPNEDGETYPTVEYQYGASGSIDDRLGRTARMDVPGWTTGTNELVKYTYLGASTPVQVEYASTLAGLGLDMIKARNGLDGAGIDPLTSETRGAYYGFDRFGRVVHHAWVTDGFAPSPTHSNVPDRTPMFARAYEYDMDSNRVLDYDARPGYEAAPGVGTIRQDRDWQYEYDGLDRLGTAMRGRQESGGFNDAADSLKWDLDILGNWKSVWTDIDNDGLFEDAVSEREERDHNMANEITSQGISDGVTSLIVAIPTYDDAGNYRQNRPSGSSRLVYTHDAWNRLVKVVRSSGSHTVLENEFNGLNWRTKRRMDLSQGAYDGVDEARTYYYSANWQILEEHVDTDLDDDTDRIGQQFWGVRYIDDAVARRVDRDGDGFSGDAADNFYYLTDVMFSVRALVDSNGLLHTRLDYTPYGVAMHGKAADINGDGVVNFNDVTAFITAFNSGTPLVPGDTGYDPDADLSADGIANIFTVDYNPFQSRYNISSPTFDAGWIDNPSDPNGPDNSIGYDGYVFDLAGATEATSTGLYMVRHRVYDPKLGRWMQRDPLGYVDGSNSLEGVKSNPVVYSDTYGLSCMKECMPACKIYGNPGVVFDQECVRRCDDICRGGADSKCPCDPKGTAVWGTPTSTTHDGISFSIKVVGEDSDCCSSFGIVQFARKSSGGKWGPWKFDYGNIGILSDPSPEKPWYDKTTPIHPRSGQGEIIFSDNPGYLTPICMEFRLVVICATGPAAGHRYGTYTWTHCNTWGFRRGVPPSGRPGGDFPLN